MSDVRGVSWIRILDNIVGLIVIVVAIVAVLELTFSFIYALEVLLVGLLAMGIAWVIMGIYVLRSYPYARLFMITTGFVAITLSLLDFIFITLPVDYLVIYPTIAMLLIGSSRLVLGFFVAEIPVWIRMLQILVGILTLNLAAFVFIFSTLNFSSIIILLVITFLANGLVRLIVSLTDVKRKIMLSSLDKGMSEVSLDEANSEI
jgi:hypothetical protein